MNSKHLVLLLALSLFVAHELPAQNEKTGAEPSTLRELRLEFHVTRADLPDHREVLNESYRGHLKELLDEVSKAGDLEKALTVKKVEETFREDKSVPATDEFPALRNLQEIYSKELKKAEAANAADLAKAALSYRGQLKTLQIQLTKLGQLEKAVEVKEEFEDITSLLTSPGELSTETSRDGIFENSLGMRFVEVPIVGGPTEKRTILFGIWETRVTDYAVFAKKEEVAPVEPEFEQGEDHPAVNVNLDEAKAFCAWLTKVDRKANKIGSDDHYRLPSDHEWSCAAGIGEKEEATIVPSEKTSAVAVFFWGKAWPPPRGAGNFHGEEGNSQSSLFKYPAIPDYQDDHIATAPVGSYSANALGLFDMEGNAMEWTDTRWDAKAKSGTAMRGGSWITDNQPSFHLSRRHFIYSNSQRNWVGFRCVLEKNR